MMVEYLGALGLVMTPLALAVGLVIVLVGTARDLRVSAGAARARRAPYDHAEVRDAPRPPSPRARRDAELDDEPAAGEVLARVA